MNIDPVLDYNPGCIIKFLEEFTFLSHGRICNIPFFWCAVLYSNHIGYVFSELMPKDKEPPQTKIRAEDYRRAKAYAEKHGIPMTEVIARALKKLEVKKVETPENVKSVELDECGECGEEIPKDSSFCPYCGVEFNDEDDEEDEEED